MDRWTSAEAPRLQWFLATTLILFVSAIPARTMAASDPCANSVNPMCAAFETSSSPSTYGVSPVVPVAITVSTVVVPITAGVVVTLVLVKATESSEMETYIRHNAVAMKQDLTVGGGPTVRDLATMYHVAPKHMDAFGQLLRDHRATLLPLTNTGRLTKKRAGTFSKIIYDAMLGNPTLAGDLVIAIRVTREHPGRLASSARAAGSAS